MNLKVYRYREGMAAPRYDTFELVPSPGMTVLEALFLVQEQLDVMNASRRSRTQSVEPVRC